MVLHPYSPNPFPGGAHLPTITAVLSAYNEEVSIGSVILRTRQYVDRVLVIDDGSTDRTAEVAELAGAEVIRHPINRGKGAALRSGFKAAKGADIIVTLDADGQHHPSEIPKLIAPILEGEADVVNGSRYMNGHGKNTPGYRRLGQKVLDKATNFSSGLDVTDSQSGFRAFAAHTIPAFRFRESGFEIESEMLVDAALAKLRVKEVDISVRYDVDCSTANPVRHGLRVLVKVLHDMELNRPLFYFTVPGIALMLAGFGIGLHYIKLFLAGGQLPFGPSLLLIMLTLIGTFSAFTGIILHTMSLLIRETKNK
ncbi:MAG: glycosyltransferase family 2 protein [ANME-2 cluster archaeon]|nr:glycosyltransferase family 2 protein [ANME-2 cluster archaeon]